MDRATSVFAALQAGKLPSTEQLSIAIDNLLKSDLLQVESVAGSPQLTKHGKQLAGDVREILSAYKALGESSNSDNILQETIWHFSQADISNSSIGSTGEAPSADAKKIGRSLTKVLEIVWSNATFEGTNLFADFASFSRLTLADAAELVESGAGSVKTALRQMEGEVQEGQRTAIGTKRPAEGEHEDSDARAKFERTMDTIKDAGSKAIGVGQQATEKAAATAQSTSDRLQDAYYKVVDRAQNDKEYRDAIETVLDLAEKWLNKTLDTAADVNQNTDIHAFVDDPTEEKHLHKALSGLRVLAERGSGDKSLDDFFGAIRTIAADIKSDPDTKAWFEKFFEHSRKSLEQPGYARSPESQNQGEWLRIRWNELRDADSDVGRKWKSDIDLVQKEISEFQARVRDTPTIERVKRAHAKFASDLGEATGVAAGGIQTAITQSLWVYQDLVNVYLPRVLGYTKGFPIPRTEYKDASTEFVLEDLDISTLAITPGHLYIRNITDIDITANSSGETDTSIGAMTHIHAKGVQLALREVSFYYHDKTATVGPSEVTGILELTMPPEGLEFDIKVRLLPNTENGIAERERIKGFHKIENVEVQVSDSVKLDIKESNHGILLTLFKPAMLAGFRRALATTLSEQLRTALEFADGVAFDISKRSVVFEDMGLTRGPALAGAIWSEVGHFMRSGNSSRAGLSQGWQLTGTGIVKRGEESTIAMGAEPQVLSGDKHGPKARLAEPLSDKAQRVADQVGVDVNMADATQTAQSVAEQATEVVQQGVQQVRGYQQALDAKKEAEEKRPGWRSEAFNATAA